MAIKFNDDPSLGQTIEKKTLMSFGASPLTRISELAFVAGANKFSQLCGFRFISKAPHQYKEFFISFVCKLRSKMYRQNSNPSQWFIFKKISDNEMHALSKAQLLAQYGFDVDQFFKSDLFEKGITIFKSTIDKGLNVQVPELAKKYEGNAKAETDINRYAEAIDEASYRLKTKQINDKFYKLINYDTKLESELDAKIEEALKEIYN